MANQNTLADLSTTVASNTNWKGQSILGTAPVLTIDQMLQNLSSMLAGFYDSLGGSLTAGGTATALTVTITEDWAAYAHGNILAIKTASAATGASALVVTVPTAGALASKKIRRQGDSAIQANDWLSGATILLKYDSAYDSAAGAWVLLNSTPTPPAQQQIARNGSFAIAQRAMPTSDNTYSLDGWRLEIENANGVVITQDTADVPTGAGYAAKLVVGSGNNGKFGLFSPVENKDMLCLRNGVCSIRVPLKATAGLVDGTGKIRIGILYWDGTADAVSADPVTTWGAEGTNPTLSGSWHYANTPAAIAVTTSWADYLVENVSIPSGATNIAIFIWSDDRATTTTTDILRIGGYVTLTQGASAAAAIVLPGADELRRAQRFLYKTFDLTTAPSQNVAANNHLVLWGAAGSQWLSQFQAFPTRMRNGAGSVATYNPFALNSSFRQPNGSTDVPVTGYTLTDEGIHFTHATASVVVTHAHWMVDDDL